MLQFFKVQERGSTPGREVVGGLTTFLAMAYIAAVNPAILSAAGVPFQAALTATCLGAAFLTILMGLVANRPLALASGMGLNAVFAYMICIGMGVDWRVGMAVVFVEGLAILVFVLCGMRKAVMEAIPADIRLAIGIGIGLFIAFIGLKGGGIIVDDASTLIALGDLTSPACIVALVSLVAAVVLSALRVPGALLISIVIGTVVGIPLGISPLPQEWNFGLDFSSFAAPLQADPASGLPAFVTVLLSPMLLLAAFSMFMSDFFDTMGGIIAIGKQADFVDEKGDLDEKDLKRILTVDSLGAVFGGFLGASSITVYVESASGVAAGARTGLANMVTGGLFLLTAFLSPLVGMVSGSATCGALTMVGYLMMTSIGDIDWKHPQHAFPAFMITMGIPFTYSIANGIGLGLISYVLIMTATGHIREIKPLMWVSSLAFLAMFIFS